MQVTCQPVHCGPKHCGSAHVSWYIEGHHIVDQLMRGPTLCVITLWVSTLVSTLRVITHCRSLHIAGHYTLWVGISWVITFWVSSCGVLNFCSSHCGLVHRGSSHCGWAHCRSAHCGSAYTLGGQHSAGKGYTVTCNLALGEGMKIKDPQCRNHI